MKAFTAVIFTMFLASQTHATSWQETKCSNSDGSVNWSSGTDNDVINLKYANFVEGILTLDMEQVHVQFSKEIVLKAKSFRNCRNSGSSKVYAGQVKITASEKFPHVLSSQFPENMVQTEVICTTTVTDSAGCTR